MERTNEIVSFDGKINWALVPANDPEWLYAFNRHTIFLNLAKAYAFTKEPKYAQSFVRLANDWLNNVPLTDESRSNTWRSLEAGLRIENWLKTLQLFAGCELITQALRDKFTASMRVHKQYLLEASGTFQALSNWGVLQDYGLLLLGITLNDDACTKMAIDRLEREIVTQVFDDGSHLEQSPMYHCEVLHCFLGALSSAEKSGTKFSDKYKTRLNSMAHALAVWCKPNGFLPCQSDSDDIDAHDLLAEAAVLFSDSTLKFYAGDALPSPAVWNLSDDEIAEFFALPATPPANIRTMLPDSDNAFLRSDNTKNAVWLHMHCGCLGSGHGHADLLHIDVFANGEDILIDSGRYTYVDSPIRRELKLPAAHNTTRVDGTDFSTCIDSWGYGALAQPIKGEYKFTATADYISGAHLGYISLPQGSAVPFRKIIYIKPDIFVIADEFHTATAHSYEQYFHFNNEGAVEQTQNGAKYVGKAVNAELICLGENTKISISDSPLSREYNTLESGKCLKAQKEADGFASMISVLSVNGTAKAELIPVTAVKANKIVPPEKAEAVRITKDGEETVVLICHQEVISEVDLLSAADYKGYGKIIVFNKQHPSGLVLAW